MAKMPKLPKKLRWAELKVHKRRTHRGEKKKHRKTVAQKQHEILVGITSGLAALALLLVGAAAVRNDFSIKKFLLPQSPQLEEHDESGNNLINKSNFLFVDTSNDGKTVRSAALMKADLEADSLVVCSLPTDTVIGDSTLNNILAAKGTKGLSQSLEEYLGIYIDRYICFTDSSFKKFISKAGGTTYNFAEKIKFSTSGEDAYTVRIQAGNQTLNGEQLIQIFRYCNDSLKDFTLQNDLLSAGTNQFLNEKTFEKGETLFKSLFNYADTNLSVSDFTENKEALKFLCRDDYSLTISFVKTDGDFGGAGFVPSDAMCREMKIQFYKEQ